MAEQPTTDERRSAIEAQIKDWKFARLNAEIAHRVAKRLKEEELQKAQVTQMTRCETAIEELTLMLKELDNESVAKHPA